MIKLIAIAFMFVGCSCADKPGPVVSIVYDQDDVPDLVKSYTTAGASAWREFGIEYADHATEPTCSLTWWDGAQALPCSIEIHITYAAGATLGHAGLTANRHTQLQIELTGDQLAEVAAHEIGHSVWNSSDHLDAIGVMSSPPTSVLPTDADRRYANEHTKGWVPL
jgi:hypothetical protein